MKPAGTDAAGWPVRLKGKVNGIQPSTETCSPSISRGVAADLRHARVHPRVPEVGGPRDVETLHVTLARLEVRAGLARQRRTIAVVAARDDVEHQRRVADRARDRPDVRDVGEAGETPAVWHAAVRRLQAVDAAERRRDAD